MADTHPALAEQFQEMPQQREAAVLGMWTFLATEILFFGALFMAYITYRHAYPDAFAAAGRLTLVRIGAINSVILLTSSFTMTLAVRAAREDRPVPAFRLLLLTVLLGAVFLVLKGFEYGADVRAHLWPGRNFKPGLPQGAEIFWFLYWVMTGVHSIHLIAGIGLLSVMAWMASRRKFSSAWHTPLELSALYWHFVDLVWIYLFPLIYLIQRHTAL